MVFKKPLVNMIKLKKTTFFYFIIVNMFKVIIFEYITNLIYNLTYNL